MRTTALLTAIVVLPGALASVAPEPSHNGKTLTEWVALMNQNPGDHLAVHALGDMGVPALPHLVKAMRTHPDGAIRFLSQIAIAKIGEAALPELDRIMEDGDPTARMQAVLALEKILGERALPRLRKALEDGAPQTRVRAHGALVRLGEPPEKHIDALCEYLLDPTANVQWIAAETLGWCADKAAGSEDALFQATQRFPGGIAERAWQALEEIGTEKAMAHAYVRWADSLDHAEAPVADKLKALLAIAKTGEVAKGIVPKLEAIIADQAQPPLLRDYAVWAADLADPYEGEPRTFHVAQEHPQADDSNPGTESKPWKTIQRAAEALRAGDTVLIHDGTYRECVRPCRGGTGPDRMITYAAAPGEKPVLKGSDLWQPEWRQEAGGIWSAPYQRHEWDHPEKWPSAKSGPMHRAEQVFVEGKLQEHVATLDELRAEAGRMFTDDEAGRLWIHSGTDASPAEFTIERSMRQQVFAPAVRGLGYLRVSGLHMAHAAVPESNGANWGIIGHRAAMSTRAGHHWVIEDNVIEWGNAQGLDIGGEGWCEELRAQPTVSDKVGYHQVRRNQVNYHGVAGIVGWSSGTNELLLEDNVTNYNCQKGNFWQYEAAGIKLHNAKDCVIRRHRAHGNRAFGIWLDYQCERNRITQCILTHNVAAGIFHEVSAGPILIDTNVVFGTRNASNEWGEGIYSHDGNHATCANNYIAGCEGFGIRFRNLFSRVADGKPTTTSHNRVLNNFLFDCGDGPVSLNPNVPRAEDNHADQNILWQAGKPIAMRLEDAGSGIKWEETRLGKATDRTGGGNLTVPLADWREHVEEDRNSIVLPNGLLFGGKTPDEILQTLRSLCPESAPGLEDAYAEMQPRLAADLVAALVPQLAGKMPQHQVRLAPHAGLQLWGEGEDMVEVRWHGSDASVRPLSDPVLRNAPRPPARDVLEVAAGDELRHQADAGLRVVAFGLDTKVAGGEVVTAVPPDTPPGEYGVVYARGDHWQWSGIRVVPAFSLVDVSASSADGNAVNVTIDSHRQTTAAATVSVRFGESEQRRTAELAPENQTVVSIPVEAEGARLTEVSVTVPGATLSDQRPLSFARAVRTDSWTSVNPKDDVPTYSLDGFPGGAFPEGAEAFALFQGGLSARWSARYDDEALHVRVEVQDTTHLQTKGPEELWQQDSVQLRVQRSLEASPLELDLALPSEGGDPIVFRRLTPDAERYPAGRAGDLPTTVVRAGQQTVYEVAIPWPMLDLDTAPATGSSLLFSLLVNDDDGGGRHGLQWFFGIHTHRDEAARMGRLSIG